MEETAGRIFELPFTDKPVLDLEATAALIEVVVVEPGASPRLEVLGPPGYEPRVDLTKEEGGGVKVRVGMPNIRWFSFLGPSRPGSLKLHVPANLRARIVDDMGRLRVEGLSGCDLNLSTTAGALQLSDLRGRLALRVDAGDIRGERLGGSFSVDAGAGSVRLGINALDPGVHHIRSSMGSLRVDLAPGLQVKVETRTALGSARNRYPTRADAAAVLQLEADLGSIRVQETGAAEDPRHGDWDDWRKHWSGEQWARWIPRPTVSDAAPPPPPKRDEALLKILTMVEQGKINAEEADRLIRAMDGR